jgi:hypothetical protein
MGTRGSFPVSKVAGREADHTPPSSAQVKNMWSHTSILQYTFMAWCSVKARGHLSYIATNSAAYAAKIRMVYATELRIYINSR